MRYVQVSVAVVAVVLAGCPHRARPQSSMGAFGVVCARGDASCDDPGTTGALPAVVAVGAALQVIFTGDQVTDSPIRVRAASPYMAVADGPSLQFTAPGFCAILARSEAGTVVDLAHVEVRPIQTLALEAPASLAPGQSAVIVAQPRDASDQPLAGSLSYAWSSSDPSVVAIDSSARGRSAKVLGVGAGTAIVTTVAGAGRASVPITVGEKP